MMERERRTRQHGAEADDRSFLGKYAMIAQILRMRYGLARCSTFRCFSTADSPVGVTQSSDEFDEFVDTIGQDVADTNKSLTFSSMLRRSKMLQLGDFNGRLVTGRIVQRVQDDLYIDFGMKFNAVCKVPAVNSDAYREGSSVLLRLHDPELSERFLGSKHDLTLLEADATLVRLLRTSGKAGGGGPKKSQRTSVSTEDADETFAHTSSVPSAEQPQS
ncbi:hypothetical protein KIN20_007810 [Parelaphostrongylus tenuis]|uniref:Mitochondrial ribosomal protein S28 n=1 Tax=Parelaphostrongylus tenuis TaxID=148309 RepID=A0AAD5MQ41_PARTN|nr:hypothetical protein KIN20_007810 [Parelaphostrongylus tenuis]